jgi:nucleoside-diphosphate-sugar epimerase
MKFTILGSSGFIGGRLVSFLRAQGHEVITPPRNMNDLMGHDLGHVIYAIGMTGNFRTQPDATIEAHVCTLQKLMKNARFESWLYLSSTRVYAGLPQDVFAEEEMPLPVRPSLDSLYDISKLLGEAYCLSHDNPTIRVARLANVYGAGMSRHLFIGGIIEEIIKTKALILRESFLSSKDYIAVDDVVRILTSISLHGKERIYNVASGQSIDHNSLADVMRAQKIDVSFMQGAPTRIFPRINVNKMMSEFGAVKGSLLDDFSALLTTEKKRFV